MPGRRRARLNLHPDMKTLQLLSRQIREEIAPWIHSQNLIQFIYYSLPTILQQIGPQKARLTSTIVLTICYGT